MNGHYLTIEVSTDSAKFLRVKNEITLSELEVAFNDSPTSELDSAFENNSFLKENFDEVILSWSAQRSTLVPNAIFNESTPKAIFDLCYGANASKGDIDYNRIAELNLTNVYEIPDWVKRYFILKYPRVITQHEGSHTVRSVLKNNSFHLKATLVIYRDYYLMTMAKHNELVFYSFFDYQNAEDVMYHMMFALQQKELSNEKGMIELIQGIGGNMTTLEEVKEGFGKIKELNKMEISLPSNYISKAQLLCV